MIAIITIARGSIASCCGVDFGVRSARYAGQHSTCLFWAHIVLIAKDLERPLPKITCCAFYVNNLLHEHVYNGYRYRFQVPAGDYAGNQGWLSLSHNGSVSVDPTSTLGERSYYLHLYAADGPYRYEFAAEELYYILKDLRPIAYDSPPTLCNTMCARLRFTACYTTVL